MPLLLKLKHQVNDEKILQDCFELLEILLLCNTETKAYNLFFARLTKELPKDNKEVCRCLKDEILKDYKQYLSREYIEHWLKHIDNKDAKLILFWIELYREYLNKEYKDKTPGLQYVYQLEHLMPQDWEGHWSDIVNNDEQKANELIHQIGNMTLLKGKLNGSIQNNKWTIKLNGDGKARNCISKNADLTINKEILDKEQWNEDSIAQRTKNLTKEFFEIWNVDLFKS